MPQPPHPAPSFPWQPIIGAGAMGFGAMLWLIALLVAKDLETLRQAPETVWLFVCGVPTSNGLVLPLLLILGLSSLGGGAALLFYRKG